MDMTNTDAIKPVILGKDTNNKDVYYDFLRDSHLLVSGVTGSGKTTLLNRIICSIIEDNSPRDVNLLLIDTKRIEFAMYADNLFLMGPVFSDAYQASNALRVIVKIVDERYNMFALNGVKDINAYDEKIKKQNGRPNEDGSPCPPKLPYIIVIIDELADLMAVAGKDVEASIQRILEASRITGIRFVIATSTNTKNVISNVIKSNIHSRIAFRTVSKADSKVILDKEGAEKLQMNGNALYKSSSSNTIIEFQVDNITEAEIDYILDLSMKRGKPRYDNHFILLGRVENNMGIDTVSEDPMFEEIKEYVIQSQKASTSLLQRRFGIGYNRAARMIDALEDNGIIGPAQGSKPREVYESENYLEEINRYDCINDEKSSVYNQEEDYTPIQQITKLESNQKVDLKSREIKKEPSRATKSQNLVTRNRIIMAIIIVAIIILLFIYKNM